MSSPVEAKPQSRLSIPVSGRPPRPPTAPLNHGRPPSAVGKPVAPREEVWQDHLMQAPQITPPECQSPLRQQCTKMLNSKVITSLMVFAFTFLLLLAVNPPIAQRKDENGKSLGRSPVKILVWSTIMGLLVFLLPFTKCFGE